MLNPAYDSSSKTFYIDGDNTITTIKNYDSSENNITSFTYDKENEDGTTSTATEYNSKDNVVKERN